jgi:hypothetical protein
MLCNVSLIALYPGTAMLTGNAAITDPKTRKLLKKATHSESALPFLSRDCEGAVRRLSQQSVFARHSDGSWKDAADTCNCESGSWT